MNSERLPIFLEVAGENLDRVEELLYAERLPADPGELCAVLAARGGEG